MLRDGLNFKSACQSLGCWDGSPSPETVRKIEAQARERGHQRELEHASKEADHRRLIGLRDEIHTAARIQREAAGRLSELRQGAIPASELEEEVCWDLMSLALDDLRDCEAAYCGAAGLEYHE